MPSDQVDAVLLACAMQNLLLAVALGRAPRSRIAARRLALALLVIVGMTMVHVLGGTGRAHPVDAVAFFPLNLPLALGPLLYGYAHALALGRAPARERLHLLPALLQCAYLAIALCLPADARSHWRDSIHDPWIKPAIEALVLLSLAGYAFAGLRLLRRYRDWLATARSDADRHAGDWIARLLAALLVALALLAALRAYTWWVGELDTWLLQLWFAAWSAWLGVEGWRHAEHAYPPMAIPAAGASHDADAEAASAASPPSAGHDWAALGERWRLATEAAGWWRAPDLTLAELAGRLGTNTAYLSRAVNEGLGTNFNGFINRMRAEDVARRLDAGPDSGSDAVDVLQLALDAGFSSKSTFNRAFKARFEMTPSEYRRRKS